MPSTNVIFMAYLHATVDDEGWLRRVILRKANEHDVTVAPRLLTGLSYTLATGDKGLSVNLSKTALLLTLLTLLLSVGATKTLRHSVKHFYCNTTNRLKLLFLPSTLTAC
jgi:hypothetical protein